MEKKFDSKPDFVKCSKEYFNNYYGSGRCHWGPSQEALREKQFMRDLSRNTQLHIYYAESPDLLFRDFLSNFILNTKKTKGKSWDAFDEKEKEKIISVIKNNLQNFFSQHSGIRDISKDEFYNFFSSNWHQGGLSNYTAAQLFLVFSKVMLSHQTLTNLQILKPINGGCIINEKVMLQLNEESTPQFSEVDSSFVMFFNDYQNCKAISIKQTHNVIRTQYEESYDIKKTRELLKFLDFDIINDLAILAEEQDAEKCKNVNYDKMSKFMQLLIKYASSIDNTAINDAIEKYRVDLSSIINTKNYNNLNDLINDNYNSIKTILNAIPTKEKKWFFSKESELDMLKKLLQDNQKYINEDTPVPKVW